MLSADIGFCRYFAIAVRGGGGHNRDSRKRKDGGMNLTLEKTGRILAGMLFPAVCPICGEKLPFIMSAQERQLVHPECEKKLRMITEPYCRRCGKPLQSAQDEYCYDCSRRKHAFDSGRSAVCYNDAAASAVFACKYGKRQEYTAYFADLMIRRLGSWMRGLQAEAVTGVPVSPERLRERGFNQAQLLARYIGEYLHLPVLEDALLRRRRTAAQKTLGPRERKRNLEHAVTVNPAAMKGIRTILLVDDIYTTGSTADVCAAALKRGGAEHVFIATVCIGGGM